MVWRARRYWYPLAYCLSLALQPSALIGLNADLKLPKLQAGAQLPAPELMQRCQVTQNVLFLFIECLSAREACLQC